MCVGFSIFFWQLIALLMRKLSKALEEFAAVCALLLFLLG